MTKPKFKKESGASEAKYDAQGKLLESAQQIWMAGLGAFARAQDQGSKLFDALIREGQTIESRTRHFTTGRADVVRDKVENTVSNVKERAADTWDRLEKVFEDRVSRSLTRLGVPGREEMQALIDRVEALNRSVRQQQNPSPRPAPSPPRKPAPRPRPAVKPAAVRKATSKAKPGSAAGSRKPAAPRK